MNPETGKNFDKIAKEAEKIGTEAAEGVLNLGKKGAELAEKIGTEAAEGVLNLGNKGAELGANIMNNLQSSGENMIMNMNKTWSSVSNSSFK